MCGGTPFTPYSAPPRLQWMFRADALTAGRHVDRGAIPAAGQEAVLLPRHINQFYQQEIAAHANQRDDRQNDENVTSRKRLFGVLVPSGSLADLIVHDRRSLAGAGNVVRGM